MDHSHHSVRAAGYMDTVFRPQVRRERLTKVLRQIRSSKVKFDAILVMGVSGTVMGAMLADRLKLPLCVVRKDDRDSHSGDFFEGVRGVKRYLFVDDLISSGRTLARAQYVMWQFNPTAVCAGFWLYQYSNGNLYLPSEKRPDQQNRFWRYVPEDPESVSTTLDQVERLLNPGSGTANIEAIRALLSKNDKIGAKLLTSFGDGSRIEQVAA